MSRANAYVKLKPRRYANYDIPVDPNNCEVLLTRTKFRIQFAFLRILPNDWRRIFRVRLDAVEVNAGSIHQVCDQMSPNGTNSRRFRRRRMARKRQVKGPVAQLVRAVGEPGPNVLNVHSQPGEREDRSPTGQRTMQDCIVNDIIRRCWTFNGWNSDLTYPGQFQEIRACSSVG